VRGQHRDPPIAFDAEAGQASLDSGWCIWTERFDCVDPRGTEASPHAGIAPHSRAPCGEEASTCALRQDPAGESGTPSGNSLIYFVGHAGAMDRVEMLCRCHDQGRGVEVLHD
jgi:hypothetical protein